MSVKRYDFDCITSDYLLGASLDRTEVADGDYVLHSDYAALLARHNALRESIHNAMERTVGCDKKQTDDQLIADVAYLKRLASDHFKTSIDCGNRVFAVEQQYDALREAVAWERECWSCPLKNRSNAEKNGFSELWASRRHARAEVDRLLQEPPC